MIDLWRTEALGELTNFINGLWKGEEPPFVRVGVIRNTNFTKEGALDDSNIAYLDVEAKKFQKRRLECGDLILEKSGGGPKQAVGRVVLFDKTEGDFSFSNFTAAIRVLDPRALDARYLHKYLHWVYVSGRTEAMQSHSTGIRNLNGDAYKAIKVKYPPLDQQRRIVALLDEAFEGIATAKANAKKSLQNVRELFDRHHELAFADPGEGSVNQRLADFASFRNGVNYTKQSKGRTVRIIGVKDFQNHFWAPLDELDTVTLDGGLSPADTITEGDIITVRSNGNPELIGRCMVVGSVSEPVTHSGFTIKINLRRDKALPTYVCQFMRSRAVRRKLIDGGNGLNIKSLNQGMLAEITVPLPRIEQQARIVGELEAMSVETVRLADLAVRKLSALDELKQSLLHQAFTGAVVNRSSGKQVAEGG